MEHRLQNGPKSHKGLGFHDVAASEPAQSGISFTKAGEVEEPDSTSEATDQKLEDSDKGDNKDDGKGDNKVDEKEATATTKHKLDTQPSDSNDEPQSKMSKFVKSSS